MKNVIITTLLAIMAIKSNAQTKLADAVKVLNGKNVIGTTMNSKPMQFFLDYDESTKSIYAKTTGGDYSNLNERIFFINDYVATYGWVSFEEENGIITYQTKLIVTDGNKIIIGLPWAVKSISSDKPFDIVCDGAMSIDNIYCEEKIPIADRKTIVASIVAKCKPQIVAAMNDIAKFTKAEIEKIGPSSNLVLSGKLRQVKSSFTNYYYGLKPSANLIASIKGQLAEVASNKQQDWEKTFDQKIKTGEYKSIADFAKEISRPNAAYEYVTITAKYNRDTEKYTYTIGEKVLTRLKEAKITYDPNGGKFVKQIELIPEQDSHPKTGLGEVSLHFTGSIDEADDNYLTNGYILNKRSFATERGLFYKGYYIVKQQGDVDPDPKKFMEFYHNYFAIRPVGLAPIISNKQEFESAFGQYTIKEQLLTGEKIKF